MVLTVGLVVSRWARGVAVRVKQAPLDRLGKTLSALYSSSVIGSRALLPLLLFCIFSVVLHLTSKASRGLISSNRSACKIPRRLRQGDLSGPITAEVWEVQLFA